MNNSIQIKIATILREIGTEKGLEKVKIFENITAPIHTLNLRNLALNSANVISIANCLKQEKTIKSISFSYNLIGDLGAIALAKSLPKYLYEIGLVDCGINDAGGIELLNWMKQSIHLKMICIEQNNFSEKLRIEFKKYSKNNPQILFIF
ncbi:MAG: hypothetical protein ACI94Y_004580 [Maribacter sp.]|jgi:hypothetical protein